MTSRRPSAHADVEQLLSAIAIGTAAPAAAGAAPATRDHGELTDPFGNPR